jgi:hypothetical protein
MSYIATEPFDVATRVGVMIGECNCFYRIDADRRQCLEEPLRLGNAGEGDDRTAG